MTDIKEFFIASNTVSNAPDYDSNVLSTLIHTVESFARVTYQSIYLIDYYNNSPLNFRSLRSFYPKANRNCGRKKT